MGLLGVLKVGWEWVLEIPQDMQVKPTERRPLLQADDMNITSPKVDVNQLSVTMTKHPSSSN